MNQRFKNGHHKLEAQYDALHNRWRVREYWFFGIFFRDVAHFETLLGAIGFVKDNSTVSNSTGGR